MDDLFSGRIIRILLVGTLFVSIIYGVLIWDKKKAGDFFWKQIEVTMAPVSSRMVDIFEEEKEETIQLEADAYPLYAGAEWGEVQKLEGGLTRVASKPIVDTTNIAGVAMPFTEYYHEKLTSTGWEQDLMREASGPGANMSYYAKDGRFIVVSFESEFKVKHAYAPSECPCDVTLSVTSGQVN